jgi:hypothetical protein
VVNPILLYQITQDMYLSRDKRIIAKLLMIDELMQQLGEIAR